MTEANSSEFSYDEPTVEEVNAGATRPAPPFRPEHVISNEIALQGQKFFIRICHDPSLLELIDTSERNRVPFVKYKKLELPRVPGGVSNADPIPLSALGEYAAFGISDNYLAALRKEITRNDYKGTRKTHTDVIVRLKDFQKVSGVARFTRPDPHVPTGASVTIIATALALPEERAVAVQLTVLPHVARRLVHHLIACLDLAIMDGKKQLEELSVIRFAYGPLHKGNSREVLYCATVCSPEHPAAAVGMPTIGSPAYSDFFAIKKTKCAPLKPPGM